MSPASRLLRAPVAAAALLLVAACGSSPGPGESSGPSGGVEDFEPCGGLTRAEAAAAVGRPVRMRAAREVRGGGACYVSTADRDVSIEIISSVRPEDLAGDAVPSEFGPTRPVDVPGAESAVVATSAEPPRITSVHARTATATYGVLPYVRGAGSAEVERIGVALVTAIPSD